MGLKDSKSNTYHGDGSTTTQGFLVGGQLVVANAGDSQEVISKAGKGETYQTTKMGIVESESSTYLDDGSTSTDKGFLVSENNTCHVDVSTTADGIADSRGSPAVKSNADKGGPCPRTDVDFLHFERNTYVHYERDTYRDDGPTTKEAISLCNDLMVSPTDVSSLDSESNTCHDDGSTASGGSQEGEDQRSFMESLPSDVVQEILSRVAAESVLDCKLVCKKWVTVVRASNFANMHLNRQLNHMHDDDSSGNDNLAAKVEPCLFFACRIDDNDDYPTLLFHGGRVSDRICINEKYIYNQNLTRIYHPPMHNELLSEHFVGSCNGLVCALQLHNTILDPIYICNPLTREYVYLPQLVVKKEDFDPYDSDRINEEEVNMFYFTACGFGYVRSTNEYKVVRIHYFDYEEGHVEVYTLGSGYGWRDIGTLSYRLNMLDGGRGTYANDVIYWISGKKVVAFDLANEEFRLVSVPRLENLCNGHECGLVALGRHLCLYKDDGLRVEICSLMRSRDSKETWCMEFDINYEAVVGTRRRKLQPILLTENGEIICLYAESVLYSYDSKTAFLKMISNEASVDGFRAVEVTTHFNTFVSLKAMGEDSKRYTVRPRRVRTPWDNVIDELDRVDPDEEIDSTRFKLRCAE